MKRLYLLATVTLLLLGALVVQPAAAQEGLGFKSLRVGLWPEYDQPSLLVIYWGELADNASYPATVSLRIPARAGAPHVVAAQTALDVPVNEVPYENTEDGDWRVITFEVSGPRFQLEYYDTLSFDGAARTGSYEWPGDYAVDLLLFEFQQPPHSSELVLNPELPGSQINDQDGLLYYSGDFGPLSVGEKMTFSLGYSRDANDLTLNLLNALGPSGDGTSSTSSNSFETNPQDSADSDLNLLFTAVVAVVFFLLGAATMRIAINIQTLNKKRR